MPGNTEEGERQRKRCSRCCISLQPMERTVVEQGGIFWQKMQVVKSPHWSKYLVVAKKAKAKEFWRLMQTVNHECLTYILLYHCPTVRCPWHLWNFSLCLQAHETGMHFNMKPVLRINLSISLPFKQKNRFQWYSRVLLRSLSYRQLSFLKFISFLWWASLGILEYLKAQ